MKKNDLEGILIHNKKKTFKFHAFLKSVMTVMW